MKRIILLTFCISLCAATYAQAVVQYGDPVYMFNQPQATLSTSTTTIFNYPGCPNVLFYPGDSSSMSERLSQAYFADSSTWVYGVAVTLYYPQVANADIYQSDSYTQIVQNVIDSILASNQCSAVTLHSYDPEIGTLTLQRKKYFHYPQTTKQFVYSIGQWGLSPARHDTVTSTEVYFESPIAITDTFFIGIQLPHFDLNDKNECNQVDIPTIYNMSASDRTALNIAGNCTIDTAKRCKWIYFPNPNDDEYFEWAQPIGYSSITGSKFYPWGLVFPILYPREDGCTAPARPWVADRGDTWATLEWDTIDGAAELAFGTDYNGTPDTMGGVIALAAGSTGHTLTGLQPGTTYGAWLRRECHWVTPTYDTTVWSPWSFVCLFNTAGASGIAEGSEVAFTLSPNPAHGAFSVETDCLPATLTLYDPQGRTVFCATLRSQRTNIGIADLPRGVYHVCLTTTDGRSTTRRLVVE